MNNDLDFHDLLNNINKFKNLTKNIIPILKKNLIYKNM